MIAHELVREQDDDRAPDCPTCGGEMAWVACEECDGDGDVAGCSVEGCTRLGEQACAMCGQLACMAHSTVNHDAAMILCCSCNSGSSAGLD